MKLLNEKMAACPLICAIAEVDFGSAIRDDELGRIVGHCGNPPPFEGGREHIFRPNKNSEPDKHAVVFYLGRNGGDPGFRLNRLAQVGQ